MKRILLILVLCLIPAPVQAAAVAVTGCSPSHQLPDDPIVHPGQPGASHMHQFFGADSTNAYSTPDTLGTSTSCKFPGDTAAYWFPTANLEMFKLAEYWAKAGSGPVSPFPFGAEIVIGFGHTDAFGKSGAYWLCNGSNVVSGPKVGLTPPNCKADALTGAVTMPNCWDGVGLVNADFAYSNGGTPTTPWDYATGPTCPAGFDTMLPRLRLHFRFSNPQSFTDIQLVSGDATTVHGDFMNAFDPASQCRLLATFTATVGC